MSGPMVIKMLMLAPYFTGDKKSPLLDDLYAFISWCGIHRYSEPTLGLEREWRVATLPE